MVYHEPDSPALRQPSLWGRVWARLRYESFDCYFDKQRPFGTNSRNAHGEGGVGGGGAAIAFDAAATPEALLGAADITKDTFGETSFLVVLAAARWRRRRTLENTPSKGAPCARPRARPAQQPPLQRGHVGHRPSASFTYNKRMYQETFQLVSPEEISATAKAVLQRTSTQRRHNLAGTRNIFAPESLYRRSAGPLLLWSIWWGLVREGEPQQEAGPVPSLAALQGPLEGWVEQGLV